LVTTATRKRQARGERRIEAILDAASEIFAEVGYDTATTNGIAAAASISPGSLYQFFPNKQAIADALIERYVRDLRVLNKQALDPRLATLPVDKRVDRMIDALVEFHRANPAAVALLAGASISPELAATTESLEDEMCSRVEPLVGAAAPGLTRRERQRSAEICTQIVKALLPMVTSASARERPALVNELKRALRSYLGTLNR
jgi:AcrR family transcriptional regulator